MADKPTINSSWADIDKEAKELAPGPFVLALPGNKRISFPDPLSMNWLEVEGFMADILGSPNSESFKKWLSEADYQKLEDANPSLAQIMVIARKLQAHYGQVQALLGEANASRV